MLQPKPLNELEIDDVWQRGVFDRLIKPVLKRAANNQIVFADMRPKNFETKETCTKIVEMLQRLAHIDATAQLADGGSMGLEFKMTRYPRNPDGSPKAHHHQSFFLETVSSSVYNTPGWMEKSIADILLWGQVSFDENSVNCFPLPFEKLKAWMHQHERELKTSEVENPINGKAMWTKGLLAPITTVCRDLKIEGRFRVDQDGLVGDLFGPPLLRFMRTGPAV